MHKLTKIRAPPYESMEELLLHLLGAAGYPLEISKVPFYEQKSRVSFDYHSKRETTSFEAFYDPGL